MNWEFPYPSFRRPILARNCVATTQPLAAQAGLSVLARGGNAVDAAVATAIALTVVEPCSNGIGGDAFAIVWDGHELAGLNASGRAPQGWTPDRFPAPTMPQIGWETVTVPGAVSAWDALHRRYGRLPLDALVEPAIRYATDGFHVTPAIARIWANQVERLKAQPGFAAAFLPHGRAPRPGELFRCPGQADTLGHIAREGAEAFYRGDLAARIAEAAASSGAALNAADLAAHRCDWVQPIGVTFQGRRIHEMPPNGQGIAALIALGILERLGAEELDPDSAEMQHLQIEAVKLGMADVRRHVGDPDWMEVTSAELLDPARLDEAARSVRRDRVAVPAPARPPEGGTVYLAAADAAGMMVSMIQSNYHGFGSGVVVPGTGIALHNRGSSFVAVHGHPNQVGPGKRPLNTIIPGFISKDGAPVAAFGVMGGSMQPQGHVQVVTRMLRAGQNPQAAIDAPRWRVEGDDLWIEDSLPEAVRIGLSERGHRLVEKTFLDFGAAQIIWRLDDGYLGASESRRDGAAVGF